MGWFDRAYERLLVGVARRSSGRVVTFIAAVLYGGVGLALPLTLGWPVSWLVWANVTGAGLAWTLTIVWIGLRVQAAHRRHLVEWTSDLRRLNAEEFEWFVGEVFRREGWTVEETGRQDAPDGNVDLRLTKDGVRGIAQCKRWEARQVGVAQIRQFAGTLHGQRLSGTVAFFVTLSDFTQQAREEAKRAGITLVDRVNLLERVERVRRKEPCPKCTASMILDRSDWGWWFRCPAPGCGGKRDLGRDPALAVELLTEDPVAVAPSHA